MQAGALDRRIELRHRTLTRNTTTGEEVESWNSTYAYEWAEKRDLKGREFFAAQQGNADISTVWRVRYRSDVVVTDKIVYNGQAYNITGIAEIGRRVGLEIQSTAVL